MVVSYHTQRANINDLSVHLKQCDSTFIPALSSRLDIDEYARKIIDNAQTIEAWMNNDLIGVVAVYCNSHNQKTAFITNVSVKPGWQGKGIATRLLTDSILNVKKLGFAKIELEVDEKNKIAIALYSKHGFITVAKNDCAQKMTADLKKDSRMLKSATITLKFVM